MKIKSETPSELVVVESTAWLSYFFLFVAAGLFYGVGLHGREHGWRAFIPAGVFMGIAAAFDLRTEVTFDNARQQAQWTRRRLFWVKRRTVAFDEIQGVVMESSTAGNNGQVYRLSILTSNGSVPMSDSYSGGRESHEELRTKILRFLKLPVEDSEDALNEQTIRSLLAEGRKIDAIQLLCSSKHIGLAAAKQQIEAIEAQTESK
ncbi:MAG: hypothetical protein WBP85_05680 [Terracidiphilus sp.]